MTAIGFPRSVTTISPPLFVSRRYRVNRFFSSRTPTVLITTSRSYCSYNEFLTQTVELDLAHEALLVLLPLAEGILDFVGLASVVAFSPTDGRAGLPEYLIV
jgi:hypothetical protein